MAGPQRTKFYEIMADHERPLNHEDLRYFARIFEYLYRSGYLGPFIDEEWHHKAQLCLSRLETLAKDYQFWRERNPTEFERLLVQAVQPPKPTFSLPTPPLAPPKRPETLESFTL